MNHISTGRLIEMRNNSCRGDVVQVDTWVAASGKNAMRRDWLVRDSKTGDILTRASR